jgi:hypothetical protein
MTVDEIVVPGECLHYSCFGPRVTIAHRQQPIRERANLWCSLPALSHSKINAYALRHVWGPCTFAYLSAWVNVHIGENTHNSWKHGVIIVNRLVSLAVQEGRVECIRECMDASTEGLRVELVFHVLPLRSTITSHILTRDECWARRGTWAASCYTVINKRNHVVSSVITNKEKKLGGSDIRSRRPTRLLSSSLVLFPPRSA